MDVGDGALRGVTAEGDAVTTTVCSGNTLKHAVSAPSADHSASALQSPHADKESLSSWLGACSPTHQSAGFHENGREHADSMNILQNVNAHPLSGTPHTGDGTEVTDSLRVT